MAGSRVQHLGAFMSLLQMLDHVQIVLVLHPWQMLDHEPVAFVLHP